jgi:hypothetical protein
MKRSLSFFVAIACLVLSQGTLAAAPVQGQIHVPRPNNLRQFFQEDARRDRPGFPHRFAIPYNPGRATTLSQGQWTTGAKGVQIWKLLITADSSTSLNIGFSQFSLPRTAQLVITNAKGQQQFRPFTAADNERHGQLWTPPIVGDGVALELRVSSNERNAVRLQIGVINYGYRGFMAAEGRSGSCNIDVVCNTQPAWNDPIRSVGAITVGGTDTCTGSLLNNTAQDRRMLFLTAHHCGIKERNASSVVAIWNYQNSACRAPGSAQSGSAGDGQRTQFSSGAVFRATGAASDFTLIEFDDQPDPAWNLFWAGWDRSGTDSPNVTGIHHPAVAEKRISFSALPSTTTGYLGNQVPGDGTHVRVTKWTAGTTEPGSSGSPLFDANRQVIGQLHGGGASCRATEDSDWYGKLSVSWVGAAPAARLSDWLDPRNAGVPAIDGIGLGNRRR